MITVFLIDDLPTMRAVLRLRLELETDIAVIGDGGNEQSTLGQVFALSPDVVILDVTVPILEQASAVSLISMFTRISTVIVLSLYDDQQTRAYAIAAGAAAVISKHQSDERLLTAIRSAAGQSLPHVIED